MSREDLELEDSFLQKEEEGLEEETDPGELEGLPKVTNDTKLGKRFNKIYAKMKEYERQLGSKDTMLNDMKSAMETMKEFNAGLSHKMEDLSTAGIKYEAPAPKSQDFLDMQIEQLNTDFNKAIEEEDTTKALQISNKLIDLKLGRINIPSTEELADEVSKRFTTTVASDRSTKLFEDWKEKNPWYTENVDAQLYADALASKLQAQGKQGAGLIKEIEEQTKRVFNIGNTNKKKAVATVEEGDYHGQNNEDEGEVSLTADEKLAAKMFGIREADLLAQRKLIGGRR